MKAIDVHSHMSTRKGYLFKDPDTLDILKRYYKFEVVYKREEEMARDFREADVKVILAGPYGKTVEEIRERDDYVAQLVKDYPDVYLSAWADVNPLTGLKGLRELERCIKDLGMIGATLFASYTDVPYNDKLCYPFYEMCIEANVPVLLYIGHTGAGAGLPGGGGYRLEYLKPIPYIDDVAANFPELKINASHPAWPWLDEMISLMLHKPNVYNDLHGWSPKYLPKQLKKEINGRLQDRFMFGADYPMFSHDRLFRDWEGEGYKPDVLEKVFYKNAQKFFEL